MVMKSKHTKDEKKEKDQPLVNNDATAQAFYEADNTIMKLMTWSAWGIGDAGCSTGFF